MQQGILGWAWFVNILTIVQASIIKYLTAGGKVCNDHKIQGQKAIYDWVSEKKKVKSA